MKFMLVAIGTRGDIEPFLAAGELLLKDGHEVVGAFPDQFGPLARESGIRFLPLDKGFIEMIEGDIGKQALGGTLNFWQKLKAYYRLYKTAKEVNFHVFREQIEYIKAESPDRIIHSIKATVPVQWAYQTGKPSLMLSPIPCVTHPIKNKSSIAFRGKNLGPLLNRWSYKFTKYTAIKYLRSYLKKFGEEDPGQKVLENAMLAEPAIFTVSPSFFDLEGQPDHVQFLGYLERNKEQHWKPTQQLQEFVQRHHKFLFVTFGSMTHPDPAGKTDIVLKALAKHGIPSIINTAAGGLEEPPSYDRNKFHFVKSIPYDWVLPKAYAAIHHGGAGTTHLAVKYGCATTIIPHIIDQYFWNNTLSELGLGPKGMSIAKMNESNLSEILLPLWLNEDHKRKAELLGSEIKKEEFDLSILKVLTD